MNMKIDLTKETKQRYLEELKPLLLNGVSNRYEIVYFFVKLGKIIEIDKSKADYKIIWFYRNWLSHQCLDGPDNFMRFFNSVEQKVKMTQKIRLSKNLPPLDDGYVKDEWMMILSQELVQGIDFDEEIKDFFERYNFKEKITTEFWKTFKDLLIQELSEVPLYFSKIKDCPLDFMMLHRKENWTFKDSEYPTGDPETDAKLARQVAEILFYFKDGEVRPCSYLSVL